MSEQASDPPSSVPDKIAFEYIKSNFFRVVKVTGALGGMTPQGELALSVYNERWPIPEKTVFPISPEGGPLGPEIRSERIGREGVIREVEFCMVFSSETALEMATWLTHHASQLDALKAQVAEEMK